MAEHVNAEKSKEEMRQQLREVLPLEALHAAGLLEPGRQLLQTAAARLRPDAKRRAAPWARADEAGTLLLFSDLIVFCAGGRAPQQVKMALALCEGSALSAPMASLEAWSGL